MWGQSRSNCFLHNSHRQKVVNTLIWYKLLYFLAYWSRFGLSHCRTVQNEELIEDEKFVLLQSGSDKFIEIGGGEAVLKKVYSQPSCLRRFPVRGEVVWRKRVPMAIF